MFRTYLAIGFGFSALGVAGAGLATWLLASAPQGVGPPTETLRRSEYGAHGATAEDLRASMSFWMMGHWAYAAWDFTIPRSLREAPDGQCEIRRAHVAMDLEVRSPAISMLSNPSACLRKKFEIMRKALDVHEEGHLDLARQAAVALTAKLAELPPQKSCREMDAAIDALLSKSLSTLARDQGDYDLRTMHGVRQGVALDPC